MKYVIITNKEIEVPILFPDLVTHAEAVPRLGNLEGNFPWHPVSAGFWHLDQKANVIVHGKSDSLGLSPRAIDAKLIKAALCGFEALLTLGPEQACDAIDAL